MLRITLLLLSTSLLFIACKRDQPYNLDGGDLVQLGANYATQRQCASCHQDAKLGAPALAGQSMPVAGTDAWGANLTFDRDTGLGKWADIEVIRAIRFGIEPEGTALCPTMPRFSQMGDLEARAIVAFLHSLPPVNHMIPDSMCPPIKPPPPLDLSIPPPPPDLRPPPPPPSDGGPSD